VVDSTGGAELFSYTQAGYPVDSYVKGQHYDEFTAGYDRRLGVVHRIGARATWREMRWVVEDAINEGGTVDNFTWVLGNPGRGVLSHVPRARRRYAGLMFDVERTGGRLRYLGSYTLSGARGNYAGEFETDTRVPASHFQQSMDWPVQWEHDTGYLPNDRRHLAKLSGSYAVTSGFTVGLSAFFATGTPLSELGTGPLSYTRVTIRERGTLGRTPSIWNGDLRLAWDLHGVTRWRPRLMLDVFNLGNVRKPVDYEQLHYLTLDRDAVNTNYLKVNQYQAPFRARLGMVVGF
jgi:hypothetical protein